MRACHAGFGNVRMPGGLCRRRRGSRNHNFQARTVCSGLSACRMASKDEASACRMRPLGKAGGDWKPTYFSWSTVWTSTWSRAAKARRKRCSGANAGVTPSCGAGVVSGSRSAGRVVAELLEVDELVVLLELLVLPSSGVSSSLGVTGCGGFCGWWGLDGGCVCPPLSCRGCHGCQVVPQISPEQGFLGS